MANFEELKQLLAQRGGGDLGAGMRNLVSPPQPSKWDEIKNYLAMGEKTPLPQEDPAIQDLRAEEPQVIQTPQEYPTNRVEQTQETEQIPALKPYSDKEKEELDWQNSTGYKILKVLGSGASGFGGAKPSDISNAWNSTENHRLNRAREENLRSPDSQISQHFRELASMYSDPKEFTVTPAQSAKDIMEAMPWLAKYMGLDIKSDLAEAKLRGGGKGSGLKRLGETTEKDLSALESSIQSAESLLNIIESKPELLGKFNSAYQTGLSKVPLMNLNDPEWVEVKAKIAIYTKELVKSLEGGRPSDFDAASYQKIVGGEYNSPQELRPLVKNILESGKRSYVNRIDSARSNKKDVSGYQENYEKNQSAPAPPKGASNVKILFPDGSSMDSPSGQVDNILKKYPGAKVGK